MLDISLAGFSSPWSFRGYRQFGVWAEMRPWLGEGGICVIRVESAEVGDLLIPSVSRFVHGINGGDSRLDVRAIECGGQFGTPIQSLLRAFELDPVISPFEARDRIRAHLLDRSLLLVFTESAQVHPNDWEGFVNLLEHYRKSANPVCLCVIVIDGRGVVNSEPVCDFLTGRPSHQVLSDASSGIENAAVWPAYVHHRVAWESGGSLMYAISLAAKLEGLSSCDDEDLELRLQKHANARLESHLGLELLRELMGIRTAGEKVDHARHTTLRAELLACNLLWRPPSMNSLHIVPWASRAFLATSTCPDNQVWALRHLLVCAPLAGEILSLCLQFESQIQTKLHGRQDRSKVSDQTIENQRRFKDGSDDYVVYPSAFPAPPNREIDLWAFAALGETLTSSPSKAVSDIYWKTLRLRNAVAHGHYVAWHHLCMTRCLLGYFDTAT